MYQVILDYLRDRPALYAPSSAPFWDDEHISASMLAAHLDPDSDGASRRHRFIEASVRWIVRRFPPQPGARLLDLGCGPGLYAQPLCEAGYGVTGVDISRRSVAYAEQQAEQRGLPIRYLRQNYLDIAFESAFDVVILIYCDFGVLPPAHRRILLQKVRRALRPGGALILDGFTQARAASVQEGRSVVYCDQGFWSAEPYACIQSNYLYPETDNYVEQYVVITKDACQCYNNWNQLYTPESFTRELKDAGFSAIELFGDVGGAPLTPASKTLCAVAQR